MLCSATGLWFALLLGTVCVPLSARGTDRSAAGAVLTSVDAIRGLPKQEAKAGYKVKFQGVVAARWRQRKLIFVVDGAKAVSLLVSAAETAVPVGQLVEVEGITVGDRGVDCVAHEVRRLGDPADPPEPEAMELRDLLKEDSALRWVKLSGVVQSVRLSRFTTWLTLRERGQTIPVLMPRMGSSAQNDLQYAPVEVTGLVIRSEFSQLNNDRLLRLETTNGIAILKAAPKNPFGRNLRSIKELLDFKDAKRMPHQLMRLRGRVEQIDGDDYWLTDGSGRIRFEPRATNLLREGDAVNLVGFLARNEEELYLDSSRSQVLALPGPNPGLSAGDIHRFTNLVAMVSLISEMRRMPAARLADGVPVRFRAALTHVASSERFFARTRGGGMEVNSDDQLIAGLKTDTSLVIDGRLKPGAAAPVVQATSILASTNVYPRAGAPQRASAAALVAGRHQSQLVTLDGVVRRVAQRDDELLLTMVRSGVRLQASLKLNGGNPPAGLLGAQVSASGVADLGDRETSHRTARMLVPSLGRLRIDVPADELVDPSVVAVTNLFRLTAGTLNRRRFIDGTVTYNDGSRMFLADRSGAVEVLPAVASDAAVGERVRAGGYPLLGQVKPYL